MDKIKFKIYTLGCKVNQYDSAKAEESFSDKNFTKVSEDADLAIINTCAVTKSAIRKGKRMITLAHQENKNAKIVVVGCWVKTYPEEAKKLNADLVLEKIDTKKIISLFPQNDATKKEKEIKFNSRHARYFLKIQDGCEQFCSYCVIPYARGPLKSRPEAEVLEKIKKVVNVGYQEIVLCGIHLGLYGRENGQGSLLDILKKILEIPGVGRIRLSSIEITEVDDDLIYFIKNNPKICPHLHIPLQAGCDKILELMNRPYNTKYFLERINKIRKAVPDISITTDVIVGFPGETDGDFKKTYNFIEKIDFSRLHVFSFSAHEKTPAATMPNQVDGKTIKKRSEELRVLGQKLEKKYRERFLGKEVEMVVEHIGKNGIMQGKCENYLDVKTGKNSGVKIGEIVKVKLDK